MTGSQWYAQAKWEVFKREDVANVYGEDTLIRFVELTDSSHLESAVAYINSQATFTDPVVRGKPVTGTWVTKSVWYEEGRPYGKAGTLRLYHAMCPQGSDTGDGLYVTEDGCSYKVTYTFFWRQASLMKPVTPGTSGIEYSIRGQSKDPVTGFWNFVLEKREQFTTWTGIVTAADDEFKTVTEQTFIGVREKNALVFKEGATAGTLWTVGNPTPGTVIENVSVSKNDNCTTNVTQRKTVAKTGVVTGGRSSKDTFATVTTVEDVSATALGEAPEPVDGVTVEHKDELDQDGLYRRTKATETEREVDGAASMTAIDKAEQVTETENRGKAAALNAPTDPEGTLSNVTNTKSKAGSWTQRLRQTVAKLWADHTIRRVRDAFGLEEEKRTDGVATADLPATPGDAAEGVWNEQTLKQRKDGKWDVAATTHTEADVAVSESVSEVTPLEKVTETESVGASPAPEPGSAAEGYIHRTVRSLTRGAKWRNRVVQRQEKEYALTFGARETYDESVTGEAGQAGSVTLAAAGGGNYETASASLTPGGLLRYAVQRIAEKIWAKTIDVGEDYFTTTQQERGVAASVAVGGGTGKAVAVSADVTPGGLLRYAKTTETAKAGQSWTLLNQTTTSFDGHAFEKVKVTLYANVEMAAAQADVAAFVAGSVEFAITRGSTTTHYYWEHDIGFGLHVNRYGKWDGTVTLRAKAVPGYATTTT